MNHYVHAHADGNIYATCSGSSGIPPGAVAGLGYPDTHYVSPQGVLTEYTEEQRSRKAQRPPFALRWSNVTMEWLIDHESSAKVQALNAAAVLKEQLALDTEADFERDGLVYQADAASRAAMRDTLEQGHPYDYQVQWKLKNNTWQTLSIDYLRWVHQGILRRNSELFLAYQEKLAALNS